VVVQAPVPRAAAQRAALVVLNMSRAVASPDSRWLTTLRAEGHDTSYFEDRVRCIIPHVNALAEAVRSADGAIVWIRPESRTQTGSDWPRSHRHRPVDLGFDAPSHDSHGSFPFLDGLAVHSSDHCFSSFSTSAFWGSPVLATLRNLRVSDVMVAGCLTEAAVVVTGMDSTNTGFLTTVVDDACAGVSRERHETSLDLHSRLFRVAGTSDVTTDLTTAV
jgi:nicotinamidase-related amidase